MYEFCFSDRYKEMRDIFGEDVDGMGGTCIQINAKNLKDISKLSKFPNENELVLRPNSVFRVVEKYTSEQLKNLTGVDCIASLDVSVSAFLNSSHATGIFSNIPANTDVIVLQEIDSDSDQELVSQQSRARYEAPSIDEVEIPGQILQ
jgi:hypothetical protein